MPKDNRIYREEVIKDVLQAHTFQPQLCKKSTQELARNYEKKQLAAFKQIYEAKTPPKVSPNMI